MATFIIQGKYTTQGVQGIKDSPGRVDAFRQLCKSHGAEMKQFYLTMGRCDLVCVVEAKDAATMAKIILSVSKLGNVSTETMQAFTEDEYKAIVGDLK